MYLDSAPRYCNFIHKIFYCNCIIIILYLYLFHIIFKIVDLVSEDCFEPLLGSDGVKHRFCYHGRTHIEYGILAAWKTVLNRDTDDSENVTGNETMLMRAIIGMFMKLDLLIECRNWPSTIWENCCNDKGSSHWIISQF